MDGKRLLKSIVVSGYLLAGFTFVHKVHSSESDDKLYTDEQVIEDGIDSTDDREKQGENWIAGVLSEFDASSNKENNTLTPIAQVIYSHYRQDPETGLAMMKLLFGIDADPDHNLSQSAILSLHEAILQSASLILRGIVDMGE